MMVDVWVAEANVTPLSARADLTPPLAARQAQSSRLKGLHEKVEKLLQVYAVPCTPESVHRSSVECPHTSYTGTPPDAQALPLHQGWQHRLWIQGGCGATRDRLFLSMRSPQ